MRLWSADLLKIVESRLLEVMDEQSVESVQTCILLGSHHVYHGRPNLSFALLGASVKIAQAMGLHREPAKEDFHQNEEHKRVWWIIYTWDRFASISYGRPLSIDDDDCDVSMPVDISESPYFVHHPEEQDAPAILYSPYQRELSKLYLIASLVLKTIFGPLLASPSEEPIGPKYLQLVKDVAPKLMNWRHELPPHLILDLNQDYCPSRSSWTTRAHTLQSLSLQLTFDNLLIVLYRPVLARQVDHLSLQRSTLQDIAPHSDQNLYPSPEVNDRSAHNQTSPASETTASSKYWWSAAVRTASVTELPQLAQLATDSHLVAFLAMNLFHAATVLTTLALSNPLSDEAQGIKRTITRVFRLQRTLGHRSALSSQSRDDLKHLIALLLRREGEAMLDPLASASQKTKLHSQQNLQPPTNDPFVPAENPLVFSLEPTLNTSKTGLNQEARPVLSMTHPLNESLTEVQRAVHATQDQPLQPDPSQDICYAEQFQNSPMPLLPNQTWDMTSGPENDYYELESINNENRAAHDGLNGFFWLWDDTWDSNRYNSSAQ